MLVYHLSRQCAWELRSWAQIKPLEPCLHDMHSKFIFKAFSKAAHVVLHKREGGSVCDVYPDAVLKVKERWIGWKWYGTLCNHRVMEPGRDKDVPNKHNPHALSWSNALHHRMCVSARAFEQMRKSDGGNRKCVSVFWVCRLCEWVASESVVPVCRCLKGLWVCDCCSSSPPSPGSSSTPAPCSMHRAGQGFLSNCRHRE